MCSLSDQREVDLVNQDSSAGEFLDPETWTSVTVRLPYDYNGGATIRVAKVDGDWLALPNLSVDEKED